MGSRVWISHLCLGTLSISWCFHGQYLSTILNGFALCALMEIAILMHSLTSYRHGPGCMLIFLSSVAIGQILIELGKMRKGLQHSR